MRLDAKARDRLRLLLVLLALTLTPVAIVLTHRAIAPLMGFIALAAATRPDIWRTGFRPLTPPVDWRAADTAASLAFLGFCLWIAVSSLWSPTPGAAKLALNFFGAGLALGAVVLEARTCSHGARRRITFWFLGAVLIALGLLFFEAVSGGLIRAITPPADETPGRLMDEIRLGRGFAALAPSLFPAAGLVVLLMRDKLSRTSLSVMLAILFVLAFWTALDYTIAANSAAVLIGSLAFILGWRAPGTTLRAIMFLAIILLIFMPVLFAAVPFVSFVDRVGLPLPESWMQRLYVWQAASAAALDCLPFGCGVDYARALGAEGRMVSLPGSLRPLPLMPTHPHNIFLQIWLELGFPGAVLAGVGLLAGGRLLTGAQLSKPAAAAAAGAATAILVSALVEMSLWQMWRLASIGLAVFGIAILMKFRDSLTDRGQQS